MGTGKGQPLASDPDLTLCSLGLWGHGLALRAPELSPSRVSESIRADAEASPLCQHRVNTANRADEDQQGACHSDMVPSGEVRLSLFLVPCMILLSTCWQQPVPPAPCSPAGGPWAGVGGPDSRLPLGGQKQASASCSTGMTGWVLRKCLGSMIRPPCRAHTGRSASGNCSQLQLLLSLG